MDYRKFYINGEWVSAKGSETCDVINPATEEIVATISLGNEDDLNDAVAAAKKAFASFSQTTRSDRLSLLNDILAVYKRRWADVAEAIKLELGAPHDLAHKSQAGVGYSHLKAFINALEDFEFEGQLGNGDQILREPIGVCGLITPWNWPINQVALKVLPVIATGCTCVLKPSEVTPLNAMIYAEILDEAGVPAGVFNLVNGDGPGIGVPLSQHPDIDAVSFTGSTRAGTAVSKNAADTVKRVTLELGGKSPNIVFDEPDALDRVRAGVKGVFLNAGQSCNALTRMLVEKSIYEEALEAVKEVANEQPVGPDVTAATGTGPVVSQIQFDRIQELIGVGIEEGATLLAGGLGRPEGIEKGYFVKPTVFGNVTNDMRIAREEIFGPVVALIPFENEEEAIEIANDTIYGLSAAVQSKDQDRALRVAKRLRAGMVHLNGAGLGSGSPFGGYKMSGNGREGGHFGIEDYLEVKVIAQPATN